MLDDADPGAATLQPRCMWCSAELPSDHETVCPSCGATLVGSPESPVPGVTAIDAEAVIRAGRVAKPRQRSRLLSWISGDYERDQGAEHPAQPGSLAPPPLEVRREMLRLEIEAEVANLQAEAGALAAEEAIESGTTIAETHIGAALAAVTEATRAEAAKAGGSAAEPDVAPPDSVTTTAGEATTAGKDQPPA